jgi:hypothetical protein
MEQTLTKPDPIKTIEQRLGQQAKWATEVEQFKKHTANDLNRINTDLVKLTDALTALRAAPPFAADELTERLGNLAAELADARQAEMNARQVAKDAKESHDLAVAFALAGANGAIDGKNAEARKVQQDKYLAEHVDVKREKAAWDAAQIALEQAQVDLRVIEDSFTATRAAAGLMAAQLTYLSGK